mgnify:CR=1 FL=1
MSQEVERTMPPSKSVQCPYCRSYLIRVVKSSPGEKRHDCLDCGNHWYLPERPKPAQKDFGWLIGEPGKPNQYDYD